MPEQLTIPQRLALTRARRREREKTGTRQEPHLPVKPDRPHNFVTAHTAEALERRGLAKRYVDAKGVQRMELTDEGRATAERLDR